MSKTDYSDYLGLEGIDLGVLKAAFLTPDRDYPLYTNALSNEEKIDFIEKIQSLSVSEVKRKVIEYFDMIQNYQTYNEKEIDRKVTELIILLKALPFLNIQDADYYWNNRYEYSRKEETGKILIEVAAAHPLVNGRPKPEFEERLLYAIQLYNYESSKGNEPIIYIPGSLHYVLDNETGEKIVDDESLSDAGKKYLIEHGIPPESIRANESNINYKGNDGVYNSADECYVATQIAKKEGCKRIASIVSPVPIYRKALIYNEFGFNPEIYSVGTEDLNHNYVGETFWSLYITYMNDQDWQSGFLAFLTRLERDIEYPERLNKYIEKVQNIIANGRTKTIPQNVQDQRTVWMDLYNKAKSNMENKSSCNNIVISISRIEGKAEFEKNRIRLIIETNLKQNPSSKVFIQYGSFDEIDDIMDLKTKYPDTVFFVNQDRKELIDEFKSGDFRKLYVMSSSTIAMREAIEYIKEGIIPIVSTVPEKNANYIKEVSSLLEEVLALTDKTYKPTNIKK